MSTRLRQAYLKLLASIGIKQFIAESSLGYDYVCHVGDFAGECPYYNPKMLRSELLLSAMWLRDEHEPVIFDVGANVGFVATQLAQILATRAPTIYAFEPVPTTFVKLMKSIERLGLHDRIHPIAAAVLDNSRPIRISYSSHDSFFAQIAKNDPNLRVGDSVGLAAAVTLDGFCSSIGIRPSLVKIDVEGSEIAVLQGAQRLLSEPDRPAILFECNPITLSECGAAPSNFRELLSNYSFYYVDDFEGQKKPFGSPVADVGEIRWVCNIFAVPNAEDSSVRWDSVLPQILARLDNLAN